MPTALSFARYGAYVGLACGVIYALGGLVYDLLTVGLNVGTALAFLALVGMPAIFAAAGFLLGALVAALGKSRH